MEGVRKPREPVPPGKHPVLIFSIDPIPASAFGSQTKARRKAKNRWLMNSVSVKAFLMRPSTAIKYNLHPYVLDVVCMRSMY